MAQTLTYTNQTATSDVFQLTAGVAEIFVSGAFSGHVVLEMTTPSGTAFLPVVIAHGPLTSPLQVPDATMDYRVRASVSGTANVYVGP